MRDNPKFIEAENILLTESKSGEEEIMPASFYLNKMYRSKVITTVIFSILGVFGFTNAILTFDVVSMLSYLFTIGMGIIFGWVAMNNAEEIWTVNHYKYAKKIERERLEKGNDTSSDTGRTPVLVASDNNCAISSSN